MSAEIASEADGSYLESLSDLFVGFLFIFIIFLMLFALLLAETQKQTETITTRLTDAGILRAQMLQEIKEALLRHGIRIQIDTRTGIARLPESLLFDSGSSTLTADGQKRILIVAHELGQILPCYAFAIQRSPHCAPMSRPILDAMFVEGHTDNVIFVGGDIDNYDLSAERAKATFLALTIGSPLLNRLRNQSAQPILGLSAYGPDRPIADNSTERGRRENRRIDLRFVVGTPSAEDLERARNAGHLGL